MHPRPLSITAIALIAAAAAIAILTSPQTATAADTTKARLWSAEDNTRLVIESSIPLSYKVSDLSAPPRLIIDIKTPIASPDLINRLPETSKLAEAPQTYLHNIRAARFDSNTLRIVFDLSAQIHYRVHRIAPIARYSHRLVIDVAPVAAPVASEDPLQRLLERLEREKRTAPTAPQSATAPQKPSPPVADPFIVMLDPGHGGEDPGAVSPNNNYEKNLVLKISHLLAQEINTRAGMTAIMTRSTDHFIPLFERVRIAHRANADIFVSIHADSVKSRRARGSSVFILSKKGASSKFARQLARQENLSDLIGGQPATSDPKLQTALRQFSRDGKERASRQLAALILENLGRINRLHSKRVESAGFAVLKSPSIPSVLVETAFISNPVEEKKLLDSHFQQRLAKEIATAIETYHHHHHIE